MSGHDEGRLRGGQACGAPPHDPVKGRIEPDNQRGRAARANDAPPPRCDRIRKGEAALASHTHAAPDPVTRAAPDAITAIGGFACPQTVSATVAACAPIFASIAAPARAPARPVTRRAWLAGALAGALALLTLPLGPALAQDPPDPRLAQAARDSALAYVVTGDVAVDEASDMGLRGLSDALAQRTTVEPGDPVTVALDEDDLSLLTFLYWPVTEDQPVPSPQAYARLNRFLRTGGVILFDTRDGDLAGTGAPDGSGALQRLAGPLDIPPLAPVPADHVLTRAFYLLDDFPGRWQGTTLWAEAPADPDAPAQGFRHANDGVSPVVIGGNSWAEAWAVDDAGQPAYLVGSGYDGDHQREMALRFGINLVMYVLSGNYKSDQVHVPELLDRLGRERGDLSPSRPQGDALRDLLRVPGLLP